MPKHTYIAALLLALAGAAPALAQETPAPADTTNETPAATTEAPATDSEIGKPYVAETHGDWQLRCVRAEDGSDPCQLYQLLKEANGNAIAEISLLALPEGGDAVAGATIITPLETLLTQQVNIAVDGGQAKRYPFTFCTEIGCVARVGFTADDIASFKKGSKAVISVVPVADPTRTVDVAVSLKGFTAGFEAVAKANAPKAP
ncbi:MAG: invasion associated locus B family protein [Rhodobacteraceae bacterium]|nr:invasion associated locus B family protein [Paracoccaceae bacterium]